jgi:predicted GNAT family acetyltransferase
MSIANLMKTVMSDDQYLPTAEVSVSIERLTEHERNETLAFLAERAIHTVILVGFIRDNGLESPLNRGTMYGCRNSEGRLEGVALIGHTTLVEARTHRALREFAIKTKEYSNSQLGPRTHLIMGEQENIEKFWSYYAEEGRGMRLACRELLLELRKAVTSSEVATGLRLATMDDLDLVAPVHAGMAEAESGINPMDVDPIGFRQRCARRIEKGRVWVLLQGKELVFKADIQADTPDVIYLEGVYVAPAFRGNGIGRNCLSHLTRELLMRTESVCVLVNEDNPKAQALYRSSNFKMQSYYYTIFMQTEHDVVVAPTQLNAPDSQYQTELSH